MEEAHLLCAENGSTGFNRLAAHCSEMSTRDPEEGRHGYRLRGSTRLARAQAR
jgi:hypothetical protein